MERVTRKIVEYLNDMEKKAKQMSFTKNLKKEFDIYRKDQKPLPVMTKHSLNYVPYQHKNLDVWRNSLRGGISYLDKKTNLIFEALSLNRARGLP